MPFRIKLEKRLEPLQRMAYLVPVASFILALLFGALLLTLAGADPWQTYRAMLEGAFGTPAQWRDGEFYSLTETLVKATPLMLTGLGVSIAFRRLFWNIGAEGQLVMGGFAAGAVALWAPELLPFIPPWAYLPLMILAGAAVEARQPTLDASDPAVIYQGGAFVRTGPFFAAIADAAPGKSP